jgi:hypothetical protein
MLRAISDAVRSPWSLAIGLVAAFGLFLVSVWLPNLSLISRVITSDRLTLGGKAAFMWESLAAIQTNFTTLGAWLVGAVAVLFGLNAAVAIHYLRRRAAEARAGGAALGGIIVAVIGAGCSSCGAIVLSTLLGAGASAAFVARLPLGGAEFSFLAVVILGATLLVTAHKASQAAVCEIPEPSKRPSIRNAAQSRLLRGDATSRRLRD